MDWRFVHATSPTPWKGRRSLRLAVLTGLLLTPLTAITPTMEASAEPATGATAQNGASESLQKGPVELLGAATETARYWRYPDGRVTTEVWPRPVRVKRNDAWAWIDTNLVEQAGAIRPKVIKGDLSLPSGEDSGSTTTFSPTPGQSLSLSWPNKLPKPKLEGNRATYVDAAGPGADLVITARPTGFRYDVVLRTRPTKAPEIKIPIKGHELSLHKASDGRLRMADAEDRNVAVAPNPVVRGKDPVKKAPARKSRVDTAVMNEGGGQTLLLKPDASYLADPDTTYPVTIQTAFSITPTTDADVWSFDPDSGNPDGPYLKAGADVDGDYSRAYLKFDISPLVGQNIANVSLSLFNMYSPKCGTSVGDGIQVRRVTSAWDPMTLSWNNQPTNTTENAVLNKAAFGGPCDPAPLTWDITAMARQWANDDIGNYGVVLMSPVERATANYRGFASSENTDEGMEPPKLTATFTPVGGPTVVNPAGADGVEVFTAPDNWGADSLPKAEAQAHALSAAQDRVDANPALLAPPYLDMVSGHIIVPQASADGHNLASAPLTGTAYISNGLADWTIPGEYSGDDSVEEGEGPAPVTEDYDFSPETPDAGNSSASLTAIADEVLDLASTQLPDADKLIAAGVSPERNQVIVQATAVTSGLRSALAQRYGVDNIAIWLRPGASRAAADDSRNNDDLNRNGGALFNASDRGPCTTAFAWGSGSTQDWMLTAGHCMPRDSDGVSTIGFATGTPGNYDSTWVRGHGTEKLPGQPTYYGDVARIEVIPGNHVANIYVGGTQSTVKRDVAGRWSRRAQEGDLYCVGGAFSGQTCNWKVSHIGWKVKYDDGAVVRWVQVGTRANGCNKGGDSGAPVYTIRPSDGKIMAKGIHSGSTKTDTGEDRVDDCVSFFTDIWDVNKAFGDRITKAK